ncbi:MAG: ABC-F family ATP-binding cassette domain-containing protein [Lachnospiraceae bacterium]|nr:ABC-F family ATP-binding cassette domain-containing protein [Lachnospiraceae bacterium]
MILQCSHITKTFLTDVILSDVSFHINDNEKAAIVGINGSGKSTLIKIIMDELEADSGEVIISKDISVGYFAQNQEYNSDRSILDEIHNARPEVAELGRQLDDLSVQMDNADSEGLESLIRQYDQARHHFEQIGGYSYESEITGVLKGLGFNEDDYSQPVKSLSGGEKTRVALAMMLLKNPDLIILDEPANHLDINSIQWLEGYLANYKGAVLVVAHDRYFLDKIVTKVIELRQAKCSVFQGNYTEYSRKKQAALDALMKQYLNQQAEIKHQEEVIAKLKSFNREKSIKRAESREKMLDKIERIDKPAEENTKMNLLFKPRIQSGNDVLSVKGLSKSYGAHGLFSDISFDIKKGEHVAIIGDNGTGKTTILKILMGAASSGGQIKFGTNVQVAYYDQEHQVLHPEKTLFEEIQDTYPDMNNTQVRNVLAAFLFTSDDVFKQIKNLSGGERGRVSLAKLMLSDANFLLLDEPTNHLDIDSKEILEHAVNNFEGTVLYVSHDRYFINTTASRILNLTQKQIVNYPGNYDYYLEKKEDAERAQLNTVLQDSRDTAGKSPVPGNKLSWQQQKEEQARLRKIENELKKTESEIEQLETRNAEIDLQLQDPANGTNIQLLQELSREHEANGNRLEELMEQWEALSDTL